MKCDNGHEYADEESCGRCHECLKQEGFKAGQENHNPDECYKSLQQLRKQVKQARQDALEEVEKWRKLHLAEWKKETASLGQTTAFVIYQALGEVIEALEKGGRAKT
jgi:hypothetical protein